MKIVNETDLGRSLDELVPGKAGQRRKGRGASRLVFSRREIAPSMADHLVYINGINPWDAVQHMEAHLGLGDCPVCGGTELRPNVYCLGCDRCGRDSPTRKYPGLPVGKYPNPDYKPINQPKFVPDPKLKGGKGRKAKSPA